MRQDTRTLVKAAFATVLGVLSVPLAGSTEVRAQIPPPPYNPYPSGILPANIDSERTRVQREVETIFGRYFAEWQALTPTPHNAGNPPILVPNGYEAQRILGGLLNFDLNISPFRNMACSSCHMPYAAFSGPIPSVNLTMVAYPGSFRVSGRQADGAAIHLFTHLPRAQLRYDTATVLWRKLLGWACDRNEAAGSRRRTGAGSSGRPPGNAIPRHGLHRVSDIAGSVPAAVRAGLGRRFRHKFPLEHRADLRHSQWGVRQQTTPVALSPTDRTKANNIYDHWGQSLSFLERSIDISPFNSKFDFFLARNSGVTLTADEMAGFQLFNGKGNCNSCHVDGRSTTLTPGQTDTGNTASVQPLFTCHGFANEGLPLNPRIALFYESRPDAFGFTPNPDGFGWRDLGIGNFLRSGPQTFPNPNQPDWLSLAPTVDGQMQVMTARDVAMTPPQCPTTEAGQVDPNGKPIPYFQKEFFHNGYIKSLKQLVHFYNTRDSCRTRTGIRPLRSLSRPGTARREQWKG